MTGDWTRLSAVAAACALLVGCSEGSDPAEVPTATASGTTTALAEPSAVAFTDCGDACEGEIDGAKYKILLPTEWNGTLLLYSHGYRSPVSAPPDYSVTFKAEPSPGYSDGGVPLARNLLSKGYALAGSGWETNGWAVSDGVRANADLYEFFAKTVGRPERVYAWGDSLGGLVTMETAEANPDWVSGAAPLCGVLGGVVPNFDLAMDVLYGIRELIDPEFQLTGYESADAASQQLVSTGRRVLDAAASKDEQADILALALLADATLQTKTQDGSTIDSQVQAAAEAALYALRIGGTVGRWDIEKRYGGNISDNTDTDYAARFSGEDRALLDEVGGAGSADRIIASLEQGERVSADKAAVRAARKDGGEPSGTIEMPTLTLHTAADQLVAVQNQSLLREASGSTEDLVQLFTVAPGTFPSDPGAPYGAGHCNFTPDSRVGMIDLLDQWVRGGQAPTQAAVTQAFGADSGFDPTFEPGPWPQ